MEGFPADNMEGFPADIMEGIKEHFYVLAGIAGKEAVMNIVYHLYLCCIDQFWADHLLSIDMIRDGIHLWHFAKKVPLLVFIEEVSEAFEAGLERVKRQVIGEFNTIPASDDIPDISTGKILGPSNTWTYLINDDPLPDFKVALIASPNIGAAAIAAVPVMLIELGIKAAGLIKRIWKKIFR
jgi:preprotein translocase subunit SecA